MAARRGFSMDSKLAGTGRDAQLPHFFRSRMYLVCKLLQISLSCQLSWFSYLKARSFPGGLGKFGTCMDGKGENPKVTVKLMRSPSPPEWWYSLPFIAEMWSYTQTKFDDEENLEVQVTSFPASSPSPSGWANPGPTLLPKNWFGNFPRGQTFLSQSLLLS